MHVLLSNRRLSVITQDSQTRRSVRPTHHGLLSTACIHTVASIGTSPPVHGPVRSLRWKLFRGFLALGRKSLPAGRQGLPNVRLPHTHTHTRAEGPQIRGPIILPVVSATSKLVQQTTAVNIVSFNNHRSSISKSSMRQTAEVLSYQIPPLIPRSYANYYRHSHQKDCRICISALATWVSSNYPILWVPAVGHSSHVSEHA